MESTATRIAKLAQSRSVCAAAPTEAIRRGLLTFATHLSADCWRYGDARNGCFRRLDGNPFRIGKEQPKAVAETKGEAWHWPIGLDDVVKHDRRDVILSEGAPDGISALHFGDAEGRLETIGIVVMLGTGAKSPAAALEMFRGRRVRIIEHDDDSGREAAQKWADQIAPFAVEVQILSLRGLTRDDGKPVSDLNDIARIHPHDFEDHRELWNITDLDSRGPRVRVVAPQQGLPLPGSCVLTEMQSGKVTKIRRGKETEEAETAETAEKGEAAKKKKLTKQMKTDHKEATDLECLIAGTIPTNDGQTRKYLFRLAKRIHDLEATNGGPLSELRALAAREWHRQASPHVESAQTEEDTLTMLEDRISRVTSTGNPFAEALAILDSQPPVIHAALADRPALERLARLCRTMGEDLDVFGLSSRQVNQALGKSVNYSEPGASYLRILEGAKIIECVKREKPGSTRASRYRYLLP